MVLERAGTASFIDVLDRVLDKGIVIDSWMRVALAGLNLLEIEGRFVVASISTYVSRSDAITLALRASEAPPLVIKPELHTQTRRTLQQARRKPSNRPNRVA